MNCKASVDKIALIPPTHVIKPSMELDSTWIIGSQHYACVLYKVMHPFTKHASCTCERAMRGNISKHQFVIILMVTNVTQESMSLSIVEHGLDLIAVGCSPCLWTPNIIPTIQISKDDGFADDRDEGVIDIGGI